LQACIVPTLRVTAIKLSLEWEPRPRGDWVQGAMFPRLSYRREGAAPTKPYAANLLNLMAVTETVGMILNIMLLPPIQIFQSVFSPSKP